MKIIIIFMLSIFSIQAEYIVYFVKGQKGKIYYNCIEVEIKKNSISNQFPYEEDIANEIGKVTEINFFKTVRYNGKIVSAIFKEEIQAVGYVNFKRGNYENKKLNVIRDKDIRNCIKRKNI